jgi:hypothetical protein
MKSWTNIIRLSIITISVADPDNFWPDPDPTFDNVRIRILTLQNFRPTFFWNFFLWKYALKSIFMDQKIKQHRFPKYRYLWLLHTKKVDIKSFIKARIRIRNQIRSQTSGSDRIRIRNTDNNNKKYVSEKQQLRFYTLVYLSQSL